MSLVGHNDTFILKKDSAKLFIGSGPKIDNIIANYVITSLIIAQR